MHDGLVHASPLCLQIRNEVRVLLAPPREADDVLGNAPGIRSEIEVVKKTLVHRRAQEFWPRLSRDLLAKCRSISECSISLLCIELMELLGQV